MPARLELLDRAARLLDWLADRLERLLVSPVRRLERRPHRAWYREWERRYPHAAGKRGAT